MTSDSGADTSPKGVWRMDSLGRPSLVASFNTSHLEGVATITNDPVRWGPWAGKIITGDEDAQPQPLIYAVATDGLVAPYPLGIHPEDFDIIPEKHDLYCVDFNGSQSTIVRLSQTVLTNYVGDLLITDSGEITLPARLFIVHWNGTNFDARAITYRRPDGSNGHLEHVTFAPIPIPPL